MARNRDRNINREPVAIPKPAPVEEPIAEAAVEEVKVEEPVEEKEEVVDAIIDGVEMSLNIRKDPEVKANNQIAILGKGVKLKVVDPKKVVKNKDGEWYKIRIFDKNEPSDGFAMKKYIKIL